MPRPRKKSSPLIARLLLWGIPVVLVLLVAAFLFVRAWLNAYLESPAFRGMIGGITSKQLKASGEYTPFHFAGAAIYSDEFKAKGTSQAFFSDLGADQIRAEINLRGLWDHVWEIDSINIQRVQIAVGHTGATAAEPPKVEAEPEQPQNPTAGGAYGWLPHKVDLRKVVINETDLKWGENTPAPGSITGADAVITPDGDAWNLVVEGGDVTQQGLPGLKINQARLRYQRPTLFITDAQLRNGPDGDGGSIAVSGEVNFEKGLDVQTTISGISITPFLREDWRAKLKGNLSGDIKVRAPMPMNSAPDLDGKLSVTHGQLEALPILDQIATFTRTQRFRQISLNTVTSDFVSKGGKTTFTNFIAESSGLIRAEGAFTIENSNIDGTFQVGVTPTSLQWLPGSQTRVFTASRDGYLWTTVRVTGPVNSPKEDLTPRLVAAAAGSVIDTVHQIIQQAPGGNTIQDAPKKLIDDFVTPLLK